MSLFPVSQGKQAQLLQRMASLGVREADLQETFTRSGGPGGQNVNKTSTAVVVTHLPTGLRVRCEKERSQALNRFLARRLILDKVERRLRGFVEAERSRIEKIRRQKRRRSRRATERMLADKSKHSEKKRSRGRVDFS